MRQRHKPAQSRGRTYLRGTVWWVDFRHTDGTRTRESVGDDHAAAEARLQKIRDQEAYRPPPQKPTTRKKPAKVVTLQKLADAYLRDLRRRNARPSTLYGTDCTLRRFLDVWGAQADVRRCVKPGAFDRFMDARRGVSNNTLRKDLRTIRCAFRFAVNRGWLPSMPQMPQVKRIKREPQVLSPDERDRLLEHAKEPRVHAIMLAACYTGARAGELRELRWGDVRSLDDPERCTIVLRGPKNGMDRTVPVHPLLQAQLQAMHFDQDADTFVFVTPVEGCAWDPNNLSRTVKAVWQDAGLYRKGMTKPMHSLRATCATLMLEAGATLTDVCAVCGWADVSTLPHYLLARSGRKAEAIRRL